MNKVRLYHLAHEWALPAQSMLEALHEAGHRLKSHFVEVEGQEVPRIRSILERAGLFDLPPPEPEPQPEQQVAYEPEPVQQEEYAAPEPVHVAATAAVAEPPPPPQFVEERPAATAAPAAAPDRTAEPAEPVRSAGGQATPAAAQAPTQLVPPPSAPVAASAAPTAAPHAPQAAPQTPAAHRPAAHGPGAPGARPAAQGPGGPGARPAAGAPTGPGGRPLGVADGFRGFAPGFDPAARRPRPTGAPLQPPPGGPRRDGPPPGGRDGGPPGRDGPGPRRFDGPPPNRFGQPGRVPGAPAPAITGPEEERRRGPGGPARPGGPPSRTAVSPAKRGGGKQTTRRAGGQAELGRGRRLERRLQERDHWHKVTKKRPKRAITANVVRPSKIEIELPISLKDLSALLAIRVPEMMAFYMKNGIMLNVNQPIPKDAIELLCVQYGVEVTVVDEADVEQELEDHYGAEEEGVALVPRQPIVVVMGHVDHGKTTLLDTIRKTKSPVAAQEAGGITQHIGAYVAEHQVTQKDGSVVTKPMTFIDTPGHEAFTEMRARGANVTDIVLLVIAADDGIMPQTKEAIQHAQAAKAHIMVALTKMDKREANKDKVLQQLAQIEGMLPTEFGGETEVVPVSATKGEGIDTLLETILTYSELLELQANPERASSGTVLEVKKTEGRGIVVTVIVQDGTLKRGDNILAGRTWCRVRMMFSDRGKPVQAAGPGIPVEVLGFDEIPDAGERFFSVQDDDELKEIIENRERKRLEKAGPGDSHIPTDYAGVISRLAAKDVKEVRVILKADTQGSLQVLKAELGKLGTPEVKCRVIRDGVGSITTADVNLAFAERTNPCVIVGFGVIAETKSRALAKEKGINIRTHTIIYDLLNDMKDLMGGALEPEERESVIGMVEIRKVFRSSKLGQIAGCFVESGIVRRNAHVRLSRDGIVRWQGELASLRRFKDDVKEVRENFECGLKLAGYDDVKEGDRLEVFEVEKIKRTL